MENATHRGEARQQPRQQDRNSSYSYFLVTHPPLFFEAMDPLEVDNWLHTTESRFGLLHYTEYKKTWYASNNFEAQQEPGGTPPSHCQLNIKFHGVSSASPFIVITYQWVFCATS
jgi:hypothetical protein